MIEEEFERNHLKEWDFLIEEIRPEVGHRQGMLQEYLLIKDYFVAFFIVMFMEYPGIQIVGTLITLGASSVIIFKSNPFKSKALFWTIFLNEIAYTIFMVIFLIILLFAEGMEFASRYKIFGYSLIGLIIASLAFNIGVGFVEMLSFIKGRCCKKKADNKVETSSEEAKMSLKKKKQSKKSVGSIKKRRKSSSKPNRVK